MSLATLESDNDYRNGNPGVLINSDGRDVKKSSSRESQYQNKTSII